MRMFEFIILFSPQKLYRFINCVELVSPHHAARELVHTLRQGQITSLFQKNVKAVRYTGISYISDNKMAFTPSFLASMMPC